MAMSSRGSSSRWGGRSERSRADVIVAGALAATCVALALGLTACKDVLNDDEDSFHLRFVNLVEDSPTLQYTVDTTMVSSSGYQASTALNPARPGSHTLKFAAVRPTSLVSEDTTDPIQLGGSFERSYAADRDYTVFAYGSIDDVKTFVIDEPSDRGGVEDDHIEWQMVNAASNVPSMDVYLTAPEARITSPQKVATLAFTGKSETAKLKLFRRDDATDTTGSLFVDFTFELRDTATGNVVFTSPKVRLGEQTRVLLAAVNNIGPGPSPVRLMGIDGTTSAFTDPGDQAAVRFVHVSPDTPALDIIRGSSLGTKLAENVAFRDRSSYVNVPRGDVDLIGRPADDGSAVFLFVEEFSAAVGQSYSAYAVGNLAVVDAHILTDDRRSVPTQARYRFLHAAPSLEGEDGLDIYVTLPGQTLDFDPTDDPDTKDDAAQFRRGSAVAYLGVTDSSIYKGGTYQVRIAETGTSRMILDTGITLVEGRVETFVLIDSETGELELMPVEETLD